MPDLPSLLATDSILWALLKNAALLIALGYIHSLMPVKERRPTAARQLGLGVLVGLIAVTVISAAYRFRDGIIFDTRSIVLGISGLYLGPLPTVVAMIITAAYRWWQGGPVAYIGVSVVFASGLVGLAWRHFRKPDLAAIRWRELIAFGYAVHVVMLAIFLAFPEAVVGDVFAIITLPVLGLYPPVTAALGRLLSARLRRVSDAERLRESEERFKLVFKGANDGWWDWDLRKNVLTYSPRWWEMLGMQPGEREPSPDLWQRLMHPEDLDRVNGRFQQALESSEEQYEFEFRLLHRAGHYISVISRGHIQRDEAGRAIRVSGTNLDITPMRRALDETSAAKSLLEAAGRIGRIGYWEVAFDGPSLFWSDITAEIHDLPAGTQVDFDHALSFFVPEYRAQIDRDAQLLRETGRPFTTEYQILTATGRRVWVQARGEAVLDGEGRVIGMRGVFQDIDRQKRAAEALRQSESNYREIFDATSDAIFLHEESSGRLLDVNAAMLRMYGIPDKETALKSGLEDLCSSEPPYSGKEALEQVRIAMEHGAHMFPWLARRADGTRFWVEVSLQRSHIGAQGRILASVRDISRRRALEQRVREAEKMESLGRLAGGIAHDFNNMLGVIIGHADLASHRLRVGEPVEDELVPIRQAAGRSAELVRQLLAFARQQVSTPRVIDLNHSVKSTLTLLDRLIGNNLALHWRPEQALWPVKIDPVQIDQVITNLVLNARDSIAGAGTITLRTANCPAAPGGRDEVLLECADTGCGMDAETLGHVFEPFFTTKPTGEGTGLGLATVYGIVDQNGGTIEVRSEPGKGSVFLLRLPRAETPADLPGVPPAPASGGGSGTLLLVEDEPAVLMLAARVLELHGYTVLSAPTPAAALEIAVRGEMIDAVISDMIMPGMNGLVLREKLRAMRPGLRFLFISGFTDGLDAALAGEPSVGFLPKPFESAALVGKVRELLDRVAP